MRPLTAGEEAAVDRLVAARADQGLGLTITDPVALDKAAAIWLAGLAERQADPTGLAMAPRRFRKVRRQRVWLAELLAGTETPKK